MRCLCFLPGNYLSSDIYRYLWEAKVVASGANPWVVAPNSYKITQIKTKQGEENASPIAAPIVPIPNADALLEKVEHSHLPAIYQPTAMLFLATSGGEEKAWRLIAQLCEVVVLLLLFQFAKTNKTPKELLLAYAWMPLILVEVSLNAHIDVAQMLFLTLGLLFGIKERLRTALLTLSLGFMTKFWALVPAGYLLWKQVYRCFKEGKISDRKVTIRLLGYFAIFLTPCFLSYTAIETLWGGGPFGSLKVYLSNWQFNGPIFSALLGLGMEGSSARLLCLAILFCISTVAILSLRSITSFCLLFYVSLIYLSATVYPWYFISILPLAILHPNPSQAKFLLTLASASLISYEVLSHQQDWTLKPALMFAEYALPLIAFGYWFYQDQVQTRQGSIGQGELLGS